jgi:hypothetical protein
MDDFRVTLSRAHDHPPDEARTRLERLMGEIAARFPGYHLQHAWADERRLECTFTFDKPGKGNGDGRARLRDGEVEIDLTAHYALPFFVPRLVADKLLRDEVAKALEKSFGG